jgi:hypothetical protein
MLFLTIRTKGVVPSFSFFLFCRSRSMPRLFQGKSALLSLALPLWGFPFGKDLPLRPAG